MKESISTGSFGPGVILRGRILSSQNLSDGGKFKLRQINGQTSLLQRASTCTPSRANWRAIAHSLSLFPSKRRLIRSDCMTSPCHTSEIWSYSIFQRVARYVWRISTIDRFAYISLMRCLRRIYLNCLLWPLESRRGDWQDGHISISLYFVVKARQPICISMQHISKNRRLRVWILTIFVAVNIYALNFYLYQTTASYTPSKTRNLHL